MKYQQSAGHVSFTFDHEVETEDDYKILKITVHGYYSPGYEAKINGPPEDCYPGEGDYFEPEEAYDQNNNDCWDIISKMNQDYLTDLAADAAKDDYDDAMVSAYEAREYDDYDF